MPVPSTRCHRSDRVAPRATRNRAAAWTLAWAPLAWTLVSASLAWTLASGCDADKREPPRPEPPDDLAYTPRSAAAAGPSAADPAHGAGAANATAPADAAAPVVFEHVTGEGFQGYIRPAFAAPNWTPTPEDIRAMEARVPEAFAAAVARGDIPAAADAPDSPAAPGAPATPATIDLATYTRQYAGHVADGRRVIDTTFICERSRQLARQEFSVRGGYTCFVRTSYDPATGSFLYWRVNAKR